MRIPTLALLAGLSAALVGCGSDTSKPSGPEAAVATHGQLPASYRFVLVAACGERQLAGRYRLVVRDGRVVEAGPAGVVRRTGLKLRDFPTLADLLDKAEHADPDAVVDLRVDDVGIPTALRIDHLPQAIDDEECYRVTRLHPLHG
jgi:hypothetical protein